MWANGCNGGGCVEIGSVKAAPSVIAPQQIIIPQFTWWGAVDKVFSRILSLREDWENFNEEYQRAHELNRKIFDYKNSGFDPPEPEIEIALNNLYWMFADDFTNEIEFRNLWYSRANMYYILKIKREYADELN